MPTRRTAVVAYVGCLLAGCGAGDTEGQAGLAIREQETSTAPNPRLPTLTAAGRR